MKKIYKFFLSIIVVVMLSACSDNKITEEAYINKEIFGKTKEGKTVQIYTLKNKMGAIAKIINYGAIIQSLTMPDRNDNLEDIVLGYDSLQNYLDNNPYFGAIVGRFGNRINEGKFSLDGENYQLTVNDGRNHLHGGMNGFDKRYWDVEEIESVLGPALKLTYQSKDMEEGYPGNLMISVTYTLTDENELRIDYEAQTDKKTILNPTHHSYFNLTGNPQNTILNHELMIEADKFTPTDKGLIPTGEITSVENTPMDFRKPTEIGARINENYQPLEFAGGYDHNWVINNYDGSVQKIASLYDPSSGRFMEVYSDQPGLQFYSGNFLNGTITGKNGIVYHKNSGLCLEAQHFPDSPNHENFPPVVLNPGEIYKQTTIYKFSTR